MKTITGIEQQRGNHDRYNIFLDDEYGFSCHVEIITRFKLKKGLRIDVGGLQELIRENNLKEAFHQALGYLSSRQRTQQEIINYLKRKGYDEEVTAVTLGKLAHYQFVDDEKYVQSFVGYKGKSQLKGRLRIRQELHQRGVDKEMIEAGLEQYSLQEEQDNCNKIAMKYFLSKQKLPLNQIKEKLTIKLLNKGYGWELIQGAMDYLDQDQEVQDVIAQQEDTYQIQARELAAKLLQKHQKKAKNPYQLKMKIIAGLKQKGFDDKAISVALEELKLN